MDLSKTEMLAIEQSLAAVGEYVAGVGMAKGLQDYTKDEALRLVACAYTAVRNNIYKVISDEVEF